MDIFHIFHPAKHGRYSTKMIDRPMMEEVKQHYSPSTRMNSNVSSPAAYYVSLSLCSDVLEEPIAFPRGPLQRRFVLASSTDDPEAFTAHTWKLMRVHVRSYFIAPRHSIIFLWPCAPRLISNAYTYV